jgi:hypothetical protein
MARAGCGPVKGSVGPTVNWAAGGNLAALFFIARFSRPYSNQLRINDHFPKVANRSGHALGAVLEASVHSEGEHCDGAAVNRKPRQGGVSVESSIDIIHPCPYAAVPILQGDDQRRHLTEDRGTEILMHCAT